MCLIFRFFLTPFIYCLAFVISVPLIAEQAFAQSRELRQLDAATLAAYDAGDYAKVVQMLDQSLAECEARPRYPEDCLDLLLYASSASIDAGLFVKAEAHARDALGIALATFGENNANTASAYGNLASSLKSQGRLREAEDYVRRDLEISRVLLGEDHVDTGISYNNLATNLDAQGRYSEAETMHRRALAIWTAAPDAQKYVAISHDNLAKNLDNQGLYNLGELEYLQALAMRRRLLAPDHPAIATTLNNLATNLDARGRFQDAERLFREALAMRDSKLGSKHPELALAMANLATNLGLQGRERESEVLQRRALAIRIDVFGSDNVETALSLANLATGIERQGRIAEATPLLREALAIFTKSLGPDHPKTLTVALGLAHNLNLLAENEEAEKLFRETVALSGSRSGLHADIQLNSIKLGKFLIDQRKFLEGEKILASEIPRLAAIVGVSHPDVLQAQAALASALLQQNRLDEAYELLDSSGRSAIGRLYQDGATIIDKRQILNEFSALFRMKISVAWQLAQDRTPSGSVACTEFCAEAFIAAQWAINSSAAYAIEHVARRRAQGDGPVAELENARDVLVLTRQALDTHSLKFFETSPSQTEKMTMQRAEMSARIDQIEGEIIQLEPDYAELVRPRAVTVTEVQSALKPDELMMVIVPAEDAGYLWAITAKRAMWVRRQNLKLEEVALTVAQLRSTMTPESAAVRGQSVEASLLDFDKSAAAALYRELIEPIDSLLVGKRVLLTVTTGPLGSLPLALLSEDRGPQSRWLIDQIALTTLPSPSALVIGRSVSVSPAREMPEDRMLLVGIGAPDLVETKVNSIVSSISEIRGRLSPLLHAARELDTIASYYPGRSIVLTGKQATEARVRSEPALANAEFVVFSTHALRASDATILAEPALVLSPSLSQAADFDYEANDGLLTLSEAMQLRLSASLVVLSACDTAAPDGSFNADDLSGLARAFFTAGAHSVLASYWPVEDNATSSLMIAMFERLNKNDEDGNAAALQNSMRQLRDTPGGRWAHPRYWAAFNLVGVP